MTFWRRRDKRTAGREASPEGAEPPRQPRSPGPPAKGTKIRLFLHPPDRLDRLLELDLPDGDTGAPVMLRCFEPPPERGGGRPDTPSRAWVVELNAEDVERVRDGARAIRLMPLGEHGDLGDGATVELSFSAGPAEARLKWWMSAPAGWAPAAALVQHLRELSGEDR